MEEAIYKDRPVKEYSREQLVFRHFPGYAAFIRDNCLVPYITEQVRTCRQIDLPMMKFLVGITDDQLVAMGIDSHKMFLTSAEQNTLAEHLERSLNRWVEDQLVIMKREDLTAEDISYAGYVRKKALMKFLPSYTNNLEEALEIINEIDALNVHNDIAASNVYIKLLKDRIQKNEYQLLEAQEQAGVGSFELEVETGKMEVTPEFRKIYEVSDFDLYTLIDNVHPEDRQRVNANRDKAIKENSIYDNEYRYLVNGKEKVLWSRGRIIHNDWKKIMIGTVMDVTSRHQVLKQLQESEERFKQAQSTSHIGNWSWDLATKALDWSDELYRIYELEPGSVDTSTMLEIHNYPPDEGVIRTTIKHALATLQPFDFNYRIVMKDGRIKTLNAKGEIITSANGEPEKLYGTVQDITEQKVVEKKLKDSQEFIKKVTDVTPSIIATYDINTGQFSFINGAIEKQLGYKVATVLEEGVPFFVSITHPDDLPALMEKNNRAVEEANKMSPGADEPVVEFKYRMKNTSGEYIWFHTFGTIFERDENGQVKSVLNISIDITSQEVAEQALFQKNLELQQSNTSLEEYAYIASHDLKEPLRKIVTFSDRILTFYADGLSDEGKHYMDKVIDSSKRMQKMINDLLYVSTITGNKDFQLCDLNFILSEALQPLDHKIDELQAIVDSDSLPMALVVPSQFIQLFQNLVGNALKFVRNGVVPKVKVTHSFVSGIALERPGLVKTKKYLKLAIEDNGIGFDNQYASRIFAIFQRLHGRTEYEGTGIGLAVCKKIVENHGGTIYAEGKPNEGAIFIIIIPV